MTDDNELDDDLLLDDDEAETDAEPETGQDDDDEPLLVAEDDDEPSRYQKRINELTAQKQQARDEAIAERKRRQQYEEELAELRRIRAEAEAQTADTELEQAREALRAAYADDDVDKIAEAHERMTAAQVKRQAPRPTVPEPAQARSEASELAPATQEWVDRNPWFMDGEQHKARRELALNINAELLAEGDLKPDAAGFYRELDRRMKQRIEQQRGQGRKPAAAAVDRGGPHGDGRRMGTAEQGAYKRFLSNWQAKDSAAMRKAFAQRGKQAID